MVTRPMPQTSAPAPEADDQAREDKVPGGQTRWMVGRCQGDVQGGGGGVHGGRGGWRRWWRWGRWHRP